MVEENKNVEKYLDYLYKKCEDNDVVLDLVNKRHLKDENGYYGGGFSIFPNIEIKLAVKGDMNRWLPTLVHEACHLDQYLEDAQVWKNLNKTSLTDSTAEFFNWLSKSIDLPDDEIRNHLKYVMELEYDCELRVRDIVKKYKLPIDNRKRTQQAISYVWSYILMYENRSWFKGKRNPINTVEVYGLAPKYFTHNIFNPPKKFKEACQKYCF